MKCDLICDPIIISFFSGMILGSTICIIIVIQTLEKKIGDE